MISPGNQNQFLSSFAPFGDLLKAFIFLSNLNGFNSSSSPLDQGLTKWKGSSKVWKEKCSKWFSHFFYLPLFLFMHYLCVLLSYFWVSLVLCYALFNMFLFVCLFVLLYFYFIKIYIYIYIYILEKYKNSMCFVYIRTYISWIAIETKFSKLCIFCSLDEHLNAQLNKWALWLMFVVSKIK